MAIKNLTVNRDYSVTLVDDMGSIISMSSALAGCLKEQLLKLELRSAITNILDEEISNGYIDMSKHEYSREDFEEEIYCDLEEEIEYGDYSALCNDGAWIREKITDTADFYGLEPNDEDEEE